MPGAIFLEGDKVNLRTVEEDAEFLRDGVNHQDVRVWMSNTRPQNLEQEEDFVDEVVSAEGDIHLLICKEGYPKGIISLMDQEEEGKIGELGIWLHPEFHGKGYGSEAAKLLTEHAFNQLNYHKVYARAQKQNKPSIGIWKKLGFEKEGEFKDHTYAQGNYQNVVYLGILQGDWE